MESRVFCRRGSIARKRRQTGSDGLGQQADDVGGDTYVGSSRKMGVPARMGRTVRQQTGTGTGSTAGTLNWETTVGFCRNRSSGSSAGGNFDMRQVFAGVTAERRKQ